MKDKVNKTRGMRDMRDKTTGMRDKVNKRLIRRQV